MHRDLDPPLTPGAIVERLGGRLIGDAERPIRRLASLRRADRDSIGFLVRARERDAALASEASVCIVSEALSAGLAERMTLIVVDDPYLYYARLAAWIDETLNPRGAHGVDPRAVVDPSARISPACRIDAGAVIGARAEIAQGAWIGAQAHVGADSRVGEASRLHPGARVLDGCVVGSRVIIHAGTVVGADGFGFAPHAGRWHKIAQIGGVVIGDDVEIGANCCIDRGALDDTVIERGCKLDNLIQIAHGVRIGEDTVIAACAGVAGSAVIGKRCQIGGAAGIAGHITICDDTIVSTMTLISRSITTPGFYSGIFPSMDNREWEKAAVVVRHLPDLRRRLRALEARIDVEDPGSRPPG
ncbi:MAG: UDP-3-O-(3-hydroxymyristoyl)glucosamine N-acyltransferase [Lautropia sp.]